MFLELAWLIIILVLFFIFLIKGADILITSISIIARRFGISKFIVGLTVVAIGTSLPELFTSIIAIITSNNPSPFILGTIIGSNTANILLVFGLLLVFSSSLNYKLSIVDQIFFVLATISLLSVIFFEKIGFIISINLLLLLAIYIYFISKKNSNQVVKEVEEVEKTTLNGYSNFLLILISVVGIFGLNIGARGVVYGITELGVLLNIPVEFLTLTTIAFATSLPEITVTFTAMKKNTIEIGIGNIIGSNISNVFLILGVSGLIQELHFITASYLIGGIFMVIASIVFLVTPYILSKKLYMGLLLLTLYVLYLIILF